MRPIITLGIAFLLALFSAALAYSTPPAMDDGAFSSSALFTIQSTTTPQKEDLSEIGSTDGILIMGFVIAFIILIPILLRRRSWKEQR